MFTEANTCALNFLDRAIGNAQIFINYCASAGHVRPVETMLLHLLTSSSRVQLMVPILGRHVLEASGDNVAPSLDLQQYR